MDRPKYMEGILDRIEDVRIRHHLSKTAFAAKFGMKPQTYNNFFGAQGSKPNLELIYGVVLHYWVDPLWLLFGNPTNTKDTTRIKIGRAHV